MDPKTDIKNTSSKLLLIKKYGPILLVLVLILGSVIWINNRNKSQINIGGTKISSSEVNDYKKELDNYLAKNPNSSFGSSSDKQALDDLILNAALKKEAKPYGISASNDDILAYTGRAKSSSDDKQAFTDLILKEKFRKIRLENEVLKTKLADKLLIKRDLLMLSVSFDTPLHNKASPNEAKKLFEEGKKKLEPFEKLMSSGASRDEIGDKADVSLFDANKKDDGDPSPYYKRLVVHADYRKGFVNEENAFNDQDSTNYIQTDVGKLYSTSEKVSELKNVGQSTGIFASKMGAHMIIRLEGKNSGSYDSWSDLLKQYKAKYVKESFLKKISLKVKSSLNSSLSLIDKYVTGEASAAPAKCSLSEHLVTSGLRAVNVDAGNAYLSGAKVNQKQTPGSQGECPGMNDTRTTSGNGWVYFDLSSCWNPIPVWTLQDDVGPNYERETRFIESHPVGQSQYYMSGYDGDNTPAGSNTPSWGFPSGWDPLSANGQTILITLRYHEKINKPPQGTITSLTKNNIKVKGKDRDHSDSTLVNWRIKLTNLNGEILISSNNPNNQKNGAAKTNWTSGATKDYDFCAKAGPDDKTRVVLQVEDLDTGKWDDAPDPDDTATVDCGGGGGPTGNLTCDTLKLDASFFDNNAASQRYQVWIDKEVISGNPDQNNNNLAFNGVRNNGTGGVTLNLNNVSVDKDGNPFNAQSRRGNMHTYVRIYKDANENHGTYTTKQFHVTDCYKASCTDIDIDSVNGSVLSDNGSSLAIKANGIFVAYVKITNEGSNPLETSFPGGGSLTAAATSWFNYNYHFGSHIPPGQSRYVTALLGAPNDINTRNLSFIPIYEGKMFLGGGCTKQIKTFKHFNVNPTSSIDMDDEDPDVIKWSSGGNSIENTAGLSYYKSLIRKRGGSSSALVPSSKVGPYTFGNVPGNQPPYGTAGTSLAPGTLKAGDSVCAVSLFEYTQGWVGPSNEILGQSSPQLSQSCNTLADKPYVQAYGADVVGGSNFYNGSDCSPSAGAVEGFVSSKSGKSGSGVQFAAIAIRAALSGFNSASLRNTLPEYPKGLTIANTPEGILGNYNDTPVCTTDYYGTTQNNPENIPSSSVSASGLSAGKQHKRTGQLTLSGGNLSGKRTVYVDGDVRITSDINYGLGSNFTLVAKGNIYIDKDVRNLGGLYIAQPKSDGSGGNIYTCANGFNLYQTGTSQLFDNCNSVLRVNGAFVAKSIKLLRTANSLRDSIKYEYSSTTKAAEVFNFSPELYIYPPLFKSSADASAGDYESITTLPPVL